ncbi:DEAD/DEAH box helicase [Streptococcus sciuri]|uniref:DEAD/DEAH box helicase n=1 Tax=Streptococcus sciuri TaxID=2973939 RepID=A0ABT2F8N8_9STRE|nr:DEAD/DEAH box helicase [Streptococcus sciuri]MCS4488851.1 DEAD/DEAH box helicase [Streptococcus sciuri]
MGRMIPGRIRNQGIALYDDGLIASVSKQNEIIVANIQNEKLQYTLDGDVADCTCALFRNKGYCEHLAALEYYLKNSPNGKVLVDSLTSPKEAVKLPKESSFSTLFLDSLLGSNDDTMRYRLCAHGEINTNSHEVWWTLKLNRLFESKSYVIRDIRAFLMTVQKEGFYQIGKHYFESLSYERFDENSQKLLYFLSKLLPDSDQFGAENFLRCNGRYLFFTSGFFAEGVEYLQALYDFSFDADNKTYSKIITKMLESQDNLFTFTVLVERHSVTLTIAEQDFYDLCNSRILRRTNTFYLLNPKQFKILQAIRSLPLDTYDKRHLFFTHDDQPSVAMSLIDFQLLGMVNAPKNYQIRDFTTHFYFDMSDDDRIVLKLVFDYGDSLLVDNQKDLLDLPFTSHYRHQERLFSFLANKGFGKGFQTSVILKNAEALYTFFVEWIPEFEKRGVVHLSKSLERRRSLEQPQIYLDFQGGFLDVSFDFSSLDEKDINQALDALFDNQPYFVSGDGKLLVFDEGTQKVSQTLQKLQTATFSDGHLKAHQAEAYKLSQLFFYESGAIFSEKFEQLVHDLRYPEEYRLLDVNIQATLRDYQRLGVQWLSMLADYGFGGILADDMGLGKTLQMITFLTSRLTKDSHVVILAPSSLIFNWQDEFKKFAPQIDVAVSYGLKPIRNSIIAENHQVIISSYATFRQDFEIYHSQNYTYDYLILDEAQVMKNAQTKTSKRLHQFKVKHCFALSGTPIENKLLEIWSIFSVVMPGLLPNKREFLKLTSEQVSHYIKPFILRRRKEDVLPELPDLLEITYTNELADEQKVMYLAQLRRMQQSISGTSDASISRQRIEILSGITRLRQICDSPSLFMDNYGGESGKVDSLRLLLTQLKENRHRVLIFSQFKGMLDIAEKELQDLEMASYKLTGSTPSNDRQEMTKAFNKGSKDAFLISLRAGGVGLNLTGADTVILIDLWWNPAVEMQAISRAHRLGQKDTVEVYRLITRGTIEEKILKLQKTKEHLVTTVLDGSESRSALSAEEIREILGIDETLFQNGD